MSYEVLARKLRPAGFDALVGQDHVVRALRHALDAGRLHHAYLFTGTRGVGKTTIARILAKALNCEQGVSSSPCEQCSICLEIKENRFIDLIEVDAASRTGVDDTRDLLENAQYLPTRGRYKVYLIDEVHMLSTASFNALLKTLEEPPEHVKFLLATTDPKKVPVTVLSRCLQFQLKNLSREVIAAYLAEVLEQEAVETEPAALALIARSAAGSMRDALSLTDQAIAYGEGRLIAADVEDMLGVAGVGEVEALLAGIETGNVQALMDLCAELSAKNADFVDLNQRLIETFHQQAVALACGGEPVPFAADELQLYYQIALNGLRDLELAPEPRSGFEMVLLRLLAFSPTPDSNVRGRLSTSDNRDAEPRADDSALQESPGRSQMASQTSEPRNQAPVADPGVAWHEVVAGLNLGGVTRAIADNSVLGRFELPDVVLLLDRDHEMLLNDAQIRQLERALASHFSAQVALKVELAELPSESPAQRSARMADERQRHAEETINQDATVNDLIAEFDGRVVEIRPNA